MATENAPNSEKAKTWEDYFGEIIKNPITTFGGGVLGGFLISTIIADKKVEKMEEQHALQTQKRDEQFTKLIEQMSVTSRRQEQFIKAFALHSGQEIKGLEEGDGE